MAENDLEKAMEEVGRFLYHFAQLESELDVVLAKLLEITDAARPIIAASIDFTQKTKVVEKLVALQLGDKNEDRALFNCIRKTNEDWRVVFAHSGFEPTKSGGLRFLRTSRSSLVQTSKEISHAELAEQVQSMDQCTASLRAMTEKVVVYQPSLDFSDPRNSGYLVLLAQ